MKQSSTCAKEFLLTRADIEGGLGDSSGWRISVGMEDSGGGVSEVAEATGRAAVTFGELANWMHRGLVGISRERLRVGPLGRRMDWMDTNASAQTVETFKKIK